MNKIKAFIAPHIGESYDLCQDRFYVDAEKMFFSVSDGVSSSFCPTYYAQLISSYNKDGEVSLNPIDAKFIFSKWKERMDYLISSGKMGKLSTQRYKRGGTPGATYGRLNFSKNNDSYTWSAAVLGDCSIVHINSSENLLPKHVILSGEKFKSNGYLYNSEEVDYYKFGKLPDQLDEEGTMLINEALYMSEPIKQNDCFLLMTDGLSDWLLSSPSEIEAKISLLLSIKSQDEFISFLKEERDAERKIENDDITLVVIQICDLCDFSFYEDNMCVSDIDKLIEDEKTAHNKENTSKEVRSNTSNMVIGIDNTPNNHEEDIDKANTQETVNSSEDKDESNELKKKEVID